MVNPIGNSDDGSWDRVWDIWDSSVAVGSTHVTIAPEVPSSHLAWMLTGQPGTVGGVVSVEADKTKTKQKTKNTLEVNE